MSQLSDALFTETQQRVLGLLYGRPDRSFYTKEILRETGMGVATIKRELDRMLAAGILTMTPVGNQHHYQANPACPIYHELLAIVQKTFGIADVIREALMPVFEQIDLAFIFGSIAKHEETSKSDIDVLLISDSLDYTDVMTALDGAEALLARPINPSIYKMDQVKEKLLDGNAFLSRVMEQPKLWIKGSDDELRQFR